MTKQELVNLLKKQIDEQNFREPTELSALESIINQLKYLPTDFYQSQASESEDGGENKFIPIKFEELIGYDFPAKDWLVEYLIPANSISVISGYPGSYKTWLLLDLAIRIAKGEKYLNEFQSRKSKVLYIDEENDLPLFKDRITALCEDKSLDIEFLSQKGFKLKNSQIIVDYCLKNNIKVVLMDSLIRIHSQDENSSTEMAKLFEEFKKFKLNGIAVIFAHHNRKSRNGESNPTEDVRGSSEIFAFLDTGLSVSKIKKTRQVRITQAKLRQGQELPPFTVDILDEGEKIQLVFSRFLMEEEKLSKSELAQEKIAALLNISNQLNQKQIIDSLKNEASESSVKKAIKEMELSGQIISQHGKGSEILYSLATEGEKATS